MPPTFGFLLPRKLPGVSEHGLTHWGLATESPKISLIWTNQALFGFGFWPGCPLESIPLGRRVGRRRSHPICC
jgi:hypothetical protein